MFRELADGDVRSANRSLHAAQAKDHLRLYSIDTGYGIKDDLLLFTRVIQDRTCEDDPAESDQGPLLRPVNRRIVHDISVVSHLHQNLKAYRASHDPFRELVK